MRVLQFLKNLKKIINFIYQSFTWLYTCSEDEIFQVTNLIHNFGELFNFERFDVLRDSIEHLSKMLLPFAFATSIWFQFRSSQSITGLNRTSELKVIAVCICYELSFSTKSVSIYYGTQSDIRVKIDCHLNLFRASVFNYEHLDILRDSIRHPSKKLLSFEFAQSFYIQFRAFRYITGLNQTSE